MNILEKIVEKANKGELAGIEDVIKCVQYAKVITDHYTSTGPEKQNESIVPPHVDAGDIRDAMARDNREKSVTPQTQTQAEMPYFTQNNDSVIQPVIKEEDDLER